MQNTEKLIDFVNNITMDYEILIVDNGSTDKTPLFGEKLANKYFQVKFLSLPERGPGLAFREGVLKARFEHLITLDMDLPIDLDFIFEANILLEEYTIVLGSKRLGEENRSFIRRWGGRLYIILVKKFLKLPYTDFSIGAKAYRKSFLLEHLSLIDKHTHYVLALTYYAINKGYKVIEIPVLCNDTRKSRFNLLHEGLYRFYKLFKFFFEIETPKSL